MSAVNEPLAYRMCPRTLEEFVGQHDIVGKGKLLYRMIKADRITGSCNRGKHKIEFRENKCGYSGSQGH